jgi:hypothetical protein
MKLRMSQNVAAAPECLVVGVGNYNSGALAGGGDHLIVVGWGHFSSLKAPEGRFSLSSLIQPPSQ